MFMAVLQLLILLLGIAAGLIGLLGALIKVIHITIEFVDKAQERKDRKQQQKEKDKQVGKLRRRWQRLKRFAPRRRPTYIEVQSNDPTSMSSTTFTTTSQCQKEAATGEFGGLADVDNADNAGKENKPD